MTEIRPAPFREGVRDGIPIALGYFAVSFTLGIAARNAGLNAFQGFLASLLNLASAGEYAGFALIAVSAPYWEVAMVTLITNARYLLEERSTSTAENFRYSKELLEEQGLDTETAVIAVVTNDFHCFRAHMIAQKQGFGTVIDVPAELPWWRLTANYYLREAFAVAKTALFD